MSDRKKKEELRARRAYREFEEGQKSFYLECGASEELCEKLLSRDDRAFRSFMRDVRRRADVDPDRVVEDSPQREYEGDEWMDDIDTPALFAAISSLAGDEIDILGDYVIRGCTQREIARQRKMSQGGVSRKLKRIFSKIRFALSRGGDRAWDAAPGADETEGGENKGPKAEEEKGERDTDEDREE